MKKTLKFISIFLLLITIIGSMSIKENGKVKAAFAPQTKKSDIISPHSGWS